MGSSLLPMAWVRAGETWRRLVGPLSGLCFPQRFPRPVDGKRTCRNLRFYRAKSALPGGTCYSFDIKNGKVTHEVGVDAKTGKVLENSVEGARHD